jgi:hypothetical protein
LHVCEARHLHIAFDLRGIGIAERTFTHEHRRIIRKELNKGLLGDVRQNVVFDVVPDCEQITSSAAKHAACLGMGAHAIRVKHGPKLTDDEVEASVIERQFLGICRNKPQVSGRQPLCGDVEHGLVEVGRDDLRFGHCRMQGLRYCPCSSGRFQYGLRVEAFGSSCQLFGVRLKDERDHEPVVACRHRPRETQLLVFHRNGPFRSRVVLTSEAQ